MFYQNNFSRTKEEKVFFIILAFVENSILFSELKFLDLKNIRKDFFPSCGGGWVEFSII